MKLRKNTAIQQVIRQSILMVKVSPTETIRSVKGGLWLNISQNCYFRLYQQGGLPKFESSFFEMIDGDRETKQTKSLAYVFRKCPYVLETFLKQTAVSKGLKQIDFSLRQLKSCDLVTIDAEMISENKSKLRRDITISFFEQMQMKLVILIEAKSIKVKHNSSIEEQLDQYIDPSFFPSDAGIPKLRVALTKHKHIFSTERSDCIALEWSELINLLYQCLNNNKKAPYAELLQEYLDFITGVDSGMKFYEHEVLSIPADASIDFIQTHLIHGTPNDRFHQYKPTIFITFRYDGSQMDTLYKVEDMLVFNPKHPSLETLLSGLNKAYVPRLLGYIQQRKQEWKFSKDDYRFYILSETEQIPLPHRPRKYQQNHCYFDLSELLSGKKEVESISDKKKN